MFILIRVSALLLIICTATSCARLTSIFREFTISGKDGISIDAKQRVVISTKDGICAEPSPDAIQSISAALSGSASYQQISASLASSISESAAYVGLSTQTTEYQKEMSDRLHLPFLLLSDNNLDFKCALNLPTFEVDGMTLIKRLTMIAKNGIIVAVHYPIFPSDSDPMWVMDYLKKLNS